MKKLRVLLLSIVVLANNSFAELKLIEKIAAVVNDDIILESDINNFLRSIKLNTDHIDKKLSDKVILRRQILEHLILDQIVLQLGKKMGIKITEKQLDQIISDIAKKNNMSIDQMRNHLVQNGIDYDVYRNQIQKEILITKVRDNEVRRRITILPQEVNILAKQLSKQNKVNTEVYLSHILISLPNNPTVQELTEAKNKAFSVIEQAKRGTNFNKLAISYSINHRAPKIEKMDWEAVKKLPPIFSEILNDAKEGDIIGPIPSIVGFYIFKINNLKKKDHDDLITVVHARHILLKQSPNQTDHQLYQKLQKIAFAISKKQISFTQAAKKFSQDLTSVNQGGDLGWAAIETYDVSLRDALMKLKKGEISTPVRSSIGWHLIELLNTKNISENNENRQKERAYYILFNRKFSEEAEKWIEEQRKNSYVKVFNN